MSGGNLNINNLPLQPSQGVNDISAPVNQPASQATNATLATLLTETGKVVETVTSNSADEPGDVTGGDDSADTPDVGDDFTIERDDKHEGDQSGGEGAGDGGDEDSYPASDIELTGASADQPSGSVSKENGVEGAAESPTTEPGLSYGPFDLIKNSQSGGASESTFSRAIKTTLTGSLIAKPSAITPSWLNNQKSLQGEIKANAFGLSKQTVNQAIYHLSNASTLGEGLINDPPSSSVIQDKVAASISGQQALAFSSIFSEMLSNPDQVQKSLESSSSLTNAVITKDALTVLSDPSLPSLIASTYGAPAVSGSSTSTQESSQTSITKSSVSESSMAMILGAFAAAVVNNEVEAAKYMSTQSSTTADIGSNTVQEANSLLTNVINEVNAASQVSNQNNILGLILQVLSIVLVVIVIVVMVVASEGALTPAAVGMGILLAAMVGNLIASQCGHPNFVVTALGNAISDADPSISPAAADLIAAAIIAVVIIVATGGIGLAAGMETFIEIGELALTEGTSAFSLVGGLTAAGEAIAESAKLDPLWTTVLVASFNIAGLLLVGGGVAVASRLMQMSKAAAAAQESNDMANTAVSSITKDAPTPTTTPTEQLVAARTAELSDTGELVSKETEQSEQSGSGTQPPPDEPAPAPAEEDVGAPAPLPAETPVVGSTADEDVEAAAPLPAETPVVGSTADEDVESAAPLPAETPVVGSTADEDVEATEPPPEEAPPIETPPVVVPPPVVADEVVGTAATNAKAAQKAEELAEEQEVSSTAAATTTSQSAARSLKLIMEGIAKSKQLSLMLKASQFVQVAGGIVEGGIQIQMGLNNQKLAQLTKAMGQQNAAMNELQIIASNATSLSDTVMDNYNAIIEGLSQGLAAMTQSAAEGIAASANLFQNPKS